MKQESYGQNVLVRPIEDYSPIALEMTWKIDTVKHEYIRMRKIYIQRAKRLAQSEYKDALVLETRPPERYTKLSDIESKRELYFLTSELAYLLRSKTTTITGLRQIDKERMKKINQNYKGMNLKTREDLDNFGNFMESIRGFAEDRIYDSDFAVDIFNEKNEQISENKMVELYNEFLKTGSRNISKLTSNINKRKKQKRLVRKRRKRRRK